MKIFSRRPEFIAAECPRCGGRLELDSNYEIGYCKECGSQVIIQNVNKKYQFDPIDKLTSFIDKQQSLIRQDKIELEKQQKLMVKEKRRLERKLWWSKNYKKVIIISVIVVVFAYIIKYLGV